MFDYLLITVFYGAATTSILLNSLAQMLPSETRLSLERRPTSSGPVVLSKAAPAAE
jgi:hypothetical protein